MANLKNTQINDTGFLQLPAGTIAQRPSSPQEGMIRYNTDFNQTEYYDGSAWRNIKDFGPKATGGDAVSNIVVGGIPYTVHYFASTGNSTFTVTKGGEVEYLIVAGGGGGGGRRGGGGGGGEVNIGTTNLSQGNYSIVVGDGAQDRKGRILGDQGSGDNGENSSAFGITSLGGGGGGGQSDGGKNGGSGGGEGARSSSVGISTATTGLGNDGGNSNSTDRSGGGGGGAGSPGFPTGLKGGDSNSGGDGGNGISSSVSGATTFYGGGGGGGAYSGSSLPGDGGLGGGGIGQQEDPVDSGVSSKHDGLSNTGGGGGGASGDRSHAAAGIGGSGIVVVRYVNYTTI